MRLYDNVKLIEETDELSKRGIHKDYDGVIVKIEGDVFTVCFYNPHNHGESAYAKVDKKLIAFTMRDDERIIREMEGHFPNIEKDFSKCFSECDVKEYDAVELLAEKPEYAINGVHKGANGCVLFPYAIEGQWDILFYNVGENNDQEIELCVDREDFKIVT